MYFKILAPFLNFKMTCTIKNAKSKKMGIKGGYNKKLPDKSPFSNNTKLL